MAKMTRTKYARIHEVQGIQAKPQRRATPQLPTMPKYLMCRICRKPIKIGVGQIAFYHKVCRQKRGADGRRKYTWNKKSVITPSQAVRGTTKGAKERTDSHEPTE
ncbi:MAG: hypothetical protein KGI71_06050 [Patescibacteria group bacterium]|nr:hypothetical protein [Patescibacteria group bacterium]